MSIIQVGDTVPDFELPDEQTTPWILSGQLELGPVLLVFFRGDWCLYDNGELAGLARRYDRIARRGVQVAGVCVDPPDFNLNTTTRLLLPFPLLCDPRGDVARMLGLWNDSESLPYPALIAVARNRTVSGVRVASGFADRPDEEEISDMVRRLGRSNARTGERGRIEKSVSVRDTERSVRPDRATPSLGDLIASFDGAMLSAEVISSRLEAAGRSRKTLAEVSAITKTMSSYRDHLVETARLVKNS